VGGNLKTCKRSARQAPRPRAATVCFWAQVSKHSLNHSIALFAFRIYLTFILAIWQVFYSFAFFGFNSIVQSTLQRGKSRISSRSVTQQD